MRLTLPGVPAALCFSATLGIAFAPVAHAQTPVTLPPAASPAATVPARIFWGGVPLPAPSDAAPFRDPLDGALCVAPQSLAPLGAAYVVDEKMGKVTFALPDNGATVTVALRSVPAGVAAKGCFVPIMEVVEGLGGKCEWDSGMGILYTRSVLTGVEVVAGQIQVKATLPIHATVTRDGSRKVILDFPGAEIGTLPKTLALNVPVIAQARTGQFLPDVARIVLETRDNKTAFTPVSDQPKPILALNQVGATAVPIAVVSAPASDTVTKRPAPVATSKVVAKSVSNSKPTGPPVVISGVTLRQVSDRKVQLVVNAGQGGKGRVPQAALNRQILTLDFLNSSLGADAAASLAAASHPFLKAARFVAGANGVARLVLDLTRTVAFAVRPGADGSVLLEMSLPQGAGGRLAGKLIVVDAGHGYQDHGAPGVNGTLEKNVNLAIASRLADTLRDAGANVIMTRSSDTFLPVNDRPRLANQAGADFFISVHADSIDYSRAINGSTVYYHAVDPYCRALGQCIAERLQNMGGIKTKGIKSDYVLHQSGLGVLRNSRMTAVLVECGYMTNPSDVRQLNDPAMQRKIAECIAFGLRDYIEGNPDVDTKNTNPSVPVTLPMLEGIPEEPVVPAVEGTQEVIPVTSPETLPMPVSPAAQSSHR